MRVALVSEFFYPTLGGVQEHIFHISKEMLARGHEVRIITPRIVGAGRFQGWWPRDLPEWVYTPVGVSLPCFVNGSRGRTTAGLGLKTKLEKLLVPGRFDLAHLHPPLAGTLPILSTAAARVPVVGTFHTSFDSLRSMRLLRRLGQKQLDALDGAIAVSPVALASIRRYMDADAEVIPNGVDTGVFQPWWQMPRDDRVREYRDGKVNIFFIGRPDPRNGLDALVRAFARVHRREPGTRLLIAGGGESMTRYRGMAARRCAPGSVVFLGPVRDERPMLYRTADIQVFVVQRAACPLTLLEGMASGLPVVTSDWDGVASFGAREEHFLVTPFDDDRALEAKLLRLIRDPGLRARIGREAHARAQAFSWQRITDKIEDFYMRVLG